MTGSVSGPHETEADGGDTPPLPRDPSAALPGTTIDRYVVLSRLGAGGMGVVLAAYDPELDRKVALKVLHGRSDGRASREARRLVREAMAMARLTHPNVITVHDVGEHAGRVFISMELVEGHTLRERMAIVRPAWPDVLELFIAAGRGLAAAHAKGIVHRDFKPDNVMVGDDGRVRVMDFGLAHDAARDSTGSKRSVGAEIHETITDIALSPRDDALGGALTHAGKIVGTPGYIAPELHRGEPADARSDQFAFSVALYEALFGCRPFAGETAIEVAAAAIAGRMRAVPSGSDVPTWVRRIALRGLSAAAMDRFPSMDAMVDALAQHRARQRTARWLGAAAVTIAIGIGGLAYTTIASNRIVARCDEAGASIRATWNPEIRAQIRDRVVIDAPEYAAVAYDKAAKWIDRYAGQWQDARTEACVATDVDKRRSVTLQARSIQCLEERQQVLERVLAQLAGGDDSVAYSTVDAASGLPPIAACMDDAILLRASASESGGPEHDAIRALLVDAVALNLGSRDELSTAAAREALSRAEAISAWQLEVEARLLLTATQSRAGEFQSSIEHAERAFYLAGREGDDGSAAVAACAAASVLGFDMRRPEDAVRWAQLAEMTIARLGETDTPRVARCLFDLGRAHLGATSYERAEELFDRARSILERTIDPEHPRLVSVAIHQGILAMDRGDYAEAERLTKRALEIAENAFGPDHPTVANALNNIAQSLDSRGESERALPLYTRALEIYRKVLGESHVNYSETLANIAVVHYQQGDYATATAEALAAMTAFERILGPEHPRVAQCLNNLVTFTASAGNWDEADGYQRRALAMREKTLGPDHPELAASLTQSGLLAASRPDSDAAMLARARADLERALAIWERTFGPDHPDSGFARNALGMVLTQQNELAAAVEQLEHALRLRTAKETAAPLRAETEFALAVALDGLHRDPQRVDALANESLARYREIGEMFAPQIGDIEAFLAKRGR